MSSQETFSKGEDLTSSRKQSWLIRALVNLRVLDWEWSKDEKRVIIGWRFKW